MNEVYVEGVDLRVPLGHPHFDTLEFVLTFFDKDGNVNKYYRKNESGDLLIYRGLLPLLIKFGAIKKDSVVDNSPHDIIDKIDGSFVSSDVLKGITLRPEQEIAINKVISYHRGLIQSATGSGKTFMIAGFIQHLYKILGYYPTTLILVPTKYLMESFQETLSSVGIESKIYNEVRKSKLSGITIAHPKSVNNNLNNGKLDMSDVKVLIGDEAHHTSCITWTNLFIKAVNAEYVLGFSASIIDSRNLPIQRLSDLDDSQVKTISVTGDILIDIPPSYYSDGSVLAKSLVSRINHVIMEPVTNSKDWHQLRSIQLESDRRSELIVKTAEVLNKYGLKTLILINTHSHGYQLLRLLSELGYGDISACSYGSGKFYQVKNNEIVEIGSDSMNKFKSGEIRILIGSSHIYEGVDIPNLDAVIMAVVGKNSRRIIQGVGRSLRRTKNGKYAYIVDYTDSNSGILSYHSSQRRGMYSNLIGVPEDRIFDSITLDQFSNLIENIESNDLEEL